MIEIARLSAGIGIRCSRTKVAGRRPRAV